MLKTLSVIALAAGLAGCQRNATPPEPGTTLVGSWRLTALQCNCPPNQPVPDELLTLDASQHFQLLRAGKLAATGTYATSQEPSCTGGTAGPKLTLSPAVPDTYVPGGAYTLQANSLIIDQCSAADGPRYTYQRL